MILPLFVVINQCKSKNLQPEKSLPEQRDNFMSFYTKVSLLEG